MQSSDRTASCKTSAVQFVHENTKMFTSSHFDAAIDHSGENRKRKHVKGSVGTSTNTPVPEQKRNCHLQVTPVWHRGTPQPYPNFRLHCREATPHPSRRKANPLRRAVLVGETKQELAPEATKSNNVATSKEDVKANTSRDSFRGQLPNLMSWFFVPIAWVIGRHWDTVGECIGRAVQTALQPRVSGPQTAFVVGNFTSDML